MKRTLIYALTITAIALIGCSKEEVKTSATGMTLIANVNEPETSKATISDSWKFSFEEGDVVNVTNSSLSGTETYYTFTKGATNFTSEDAQTTAASADWSAFFPSNEFSLKGQSGTMSGVANYFGYAGKQTGVAAHSKTLNITMSPKMAILKVVNNKGSIQLRAKTSMGKYISCMIANPSGPSFTVGVSDDAVNLFSTSNTGTYYVAVPAAYIFDLYDGNTLLKSITADKLVAGKYYTLTMGSSTTDLSKDGNANCYIVSTAGTYKFKAVQGNSSTSVGTVSSAAVLWESYGTRTALSVGDLIKTDVSYADNYITFSTNDTYKEGNAVIAAKDGSGNILWSWHIWLTDSPSVQTYNNNAGKMMDRNLGATNATAGADGSCGLLYQWGRKDPFIGGSGITTAAVSTPSNPTAFEAASSHLSGNNTLAYSIANPTTFITNGSSPNDWYCTDATNKNDNLWKNASDPYKTIYDPCPVGYRVPDGGTSSAKTGVWSQAFDTYSYWTTIGNWDNTKKGMDFGTTDKKLVGTGSDTCWYPAAGYRHGSDGSLYDVGDGGYCWSCTPCSYGAYYLYFYYIGYVNPSNYYYRAYGRSVRCLSESE